MGDWIGSTFGDTSDGMHEHADGSYLDAPRLSH
jgi:hypothetical protein